MTLCVPTVSVSFYTNEEHFKVCHLVFNSHLIVLFKALLGPGWSTTLQHAVTPPTQDEKTRLMALPVADDLALA